MILVVTGYFVTSEPYSSTHQFHTLFLTNGLETLFLNPSDQDYFYLLVNNVFVIDVGNPN